MGAGGHRTVLEPGPNLAAAGQRYGTRKSGRPDHREAAVDGREAEAYNWGMTVQIFRGLLRSGRSDRSDS